MSQGKSTTCGIDTGFSKFSEFRNDREKRSFISCGAAAGVAAAFGAPIGGVLFCLEEGDSFISPALMLRTFFSAVTAALTVDLFLSFLYDDVNFGSLSQPGMLSFGSFALQDEVSPYQAWELVSFGIIGAIGGILGGLFNLVNLYITRRRKNGRWPYTEATIASIFSSLVACISPYVLLHTSRCIPVARCVTETVSAQSIGLETPTQFFCKKGEFNVDATISFNPSESVIKYLFHAPEKCSPNLLSSSFFFVFYSLLACYSYGLAIPAGLFVPGILSGALYGRVAGTCLLKLYDYHDIVSHAPVGVYSLVGAAAMLGGISRICVALVVILIECTGDMQLSVPCMVAVFVARVFGDLISGGIYDMHIELANFPFLPFHAPSYYSKLCVSNVMSKEPRCILPVEKSEVIFDVLSTTSHNAFPVVDKDNKLLGLMLRKHLSVLMSKGFKHQTFQNSEMTEESETLSWMDLEGKYPRYPTFDVLTEEEKQLHIDVRPYMNRSPHLLNEVASAKQAFRLFREVGLRHLIIVNNALQVTGIITRKDLQLNAVKRKYQEAK